jgi:septum formation protein
VLGPAEQKVEFVDLTRLTMRKLSDEAILRYIQHDNPLDCAGSYKIESAGIALFQKIETADHSAITGLPLLRLVDVLIDHGIEIP